MKNKIQNTLKKKYKNYKKCKNTYLILQKINDTKIFTLSDIQTSSPSSKSSSSI